MRIETAKILTAFIGNRSSLISDFEQWIYSNSSLEEELGSEIYTDLITLNFKDTSIRDRVKELVDPIIDYADLHKNEILTIVEGLIFQIIKPLKGIRQLYSLAEKGYIFLGEIDVIGNFGEQGKSIMHLIDNKMNNELQWDILLKNEPNFINDLTQLKVKLETNRIALTGKKEVVKYCGEQFKYEEN